MLFLGATSNLVETLNLNSVRHIGKVQIETQVIRGLPENTSRAVVLKNIQTATSSETFQCEISLKLYGTLQISVILTLKFHLKIKNQKKLQNLKN